MASRSSRRGSGWALLFALLLADRAAAQEPFCITQTDPPFADRAQPVGNEVEGRTASGFEVYEGEVLCLSTPPGADHVRSLRVVPRAPLANSVIVRLSANDGRGSSMQITNHRPEPVAYRFGVPAERDGAIFEPRAGTVAARSSREHEVASRVRKIVLFDLRSPATTEKRKTAYYLSILAASAFHHNDLDALNAEFARNGFGEVSSLQPYLGFAFDGGIERFRASWDLLLGLHRSGEGRAPDVDQVLIALHAGYAVYADQRLSLAPMLGIAGGDLGVDVNPPRTPLLPEQFADDDPSERVRTNLGVALFSLAAEWRVPIWSRSGLLIGLRGGYAHQFAQADWVHDDASSPDLRGAPDVDTSGPYLRLGLGIYAH